MKKVVFMLAIAMVIGLGLSSCARSGHCQAHKTSNHR